MSSRIGRISATGLLAAGAIGLAPAPAFAAGTDLGVTLTGVGLAADSAVKLATLTITNHGTTVPDAVELRFDATALDTAKVTLAEPDLQCRTDDDITTCRFAGELPEPGRSVKLPLAVQRRPGAVGAAGRLTVTVAVAGDTRTADNSRTVDVTIADRRVDLSVVAEDVTATGDGDEPTGEPIPPGGVGTLFAVVFNQGDTTAAGIKVDVTLPERSTVAGPVDGCAQSPDRRSLSCVLDRARLDPFIDAEEVERAALFFTAQVRVARDAAGPVSLNGGVVTAVALGHDTGGARRARTAEELPDSFSRPTAADLAAIDADPTDNTDHFAVVVAGPAGGGPVGGGLVDGGPVGGGLVDGGPVGGGSAGGGGVVAGGQAGGVPGGGLPVTGPALPVIGFGGSAVAALGVLLYVIARRRRVRLIAPEDGR